MSSWLTPAARAITHAPVAASSTPSGPNHFGEIIGQNERARYLNPNTGRFWTMDTYEGDNEDPLSLHRYLYCQDNPVNGTDPFGHDDLVSLSIAEDIGASLDSMEGVVDATAESSMTESLFASEVEAGTEVEEAVEGEEAVKDGFIQTAKQTLKMVGKTVRGLIEDAKKLKKLAKDAKVIPMPAEVIPDVCANITTAMTTPPWMSPFFLERCLPDRVPVNRRKALLGKGPAGVGLSWDEYPFASSIQGGLNTRVVAVPFWQNCVQGGIISACYKIEDITPETPYTVVVIPR
jgi:RHS repeat-associated protein